MARRIPWSFLLGMGAGVGLLVVLAGRRRRAPSQRHVALLREPEVLRSAGPTPVEAGFERAVASGSPDLVPGRSIRSPSSPHHTVSPGRSRFEPVAADAPEERDPSLEPRGEDPDSPVSPVPPQVRRRH
jgi:hypothetical protein